MLKDIIFTFGKKTLTQKRENGIGTKFAPPYSILFMVELEENIIKESEYKLYLWWRYTDEIIFFWKRGENELKSFIHKINKVHPTIKFTADWSKTSINFLDITVSLMEGLKKLIYILRLQTVINIYNLVRFTLLIVESVYHLLRVKVIPHLFRN